MRKVRIAGVITVALALGLGGLAPPHALAAAQVPFKGSDRGGFTVRARRTQWRRTRTNGPFCGN